MIDNMILDYLVNKMTSCLLTAAILVKNTFSFFKNNDHMWTKESLENVTYGKEWFTNADMQDFQKYGPPQSEQIFQRY